MTRSISHELRYDGATPDQVYAMLADPGFRRQVCARQHFSRYDVTVTPAGEGMRVLVDQFRPASDVPSFARRLVGEEINIRQEEEWSSPLRARLTVSIPGRPGQMKGSVELAGSGAGTTEIVAAEVKVGIPLVAGKVESLIAESLVRALETENRVGREWLAS